MKEVRFKYQYPAYGTWFVASTIFFRVVWNPEAALWIKLGLAAVVMATLIFMTVQIYRIKIKKPFYIFVFGTVLELIAITGSMIFSNSLQ